MRQSQRIALYEEALDALRAAGLVYECWCTRAEIREAASAPHGDLPDGAYPGTCLRLSASERAEREAAGRPPALRVRADAARVAFDDRLAGRFEGVVDDFVVRRNDGAFAYNLAVVVDDAQQGVREVVRGADLLDSTPRQLWLGGRLGLPAPRHAHVALMLGPDGERLAKRHGAVTLADRAAVGQSAARRPRRARRVAGARRARRGPHARRAGRALLRRRPEGSGMSGGCRTWLPVTIIVAGFVLAAVIGLQRDRPGGRDAARLRRALGLADQPALPDRRQGRSRARRRGPRTRLFRRARALARRGAGPGWPLNT